MWRLSVFFTHLIEAIVLVSALSIDAFAAGFSYGADRIRVPVSSSLIISLICSGLLGVSLLLGTAVQPILSPGLATGIGFAILAVLGIVKLFDSSLKAWIRRHPTWKKRCQFSLPHLHLILTIYADPPAADLDRSQSLSPAESVSLAIAMSLDGLGVGLGAGLTQSPWLLTIGVSLLLTLLAVWGGARLGNRLAAHLNKDFSWLSGLMLLLLAFGKL